MKPAWDKLMAEFKDHQHGLVADVDCTADGKSLCNSVGVRGYPTIKWGHPEALEDYKGGRDYAALSKFAKDNLKPVCSPDNLDLCDADTKAKLDVLMAKSVEDLSTEIKAEEGKIEAAEIKFNELVKGLQAQYEQYDKDKTATVEAVKSSDLGLMKAIVASRKKTAGKAEL